MGGPCRGFKEVQVEPPVSADEEAPAIGSMV